MNFIHVSNVRYRPPIMGRGMYGIAVVFLLVVLLRLSAHLCTGMMNSRSLYPEVYGEDASYLPTRAP